MILHLQILDSEKHLKYGPMSRNKVQIFSIPEIKTPGRNNINPSEQEEHNDGIDESLYSQPSGSDKGTIYGHISTWDSSDYYYKARKYSNYKCDVKK